MANSQFSPKRIQVSKANAMIIGLLAGAAFVSTFSLVASKALLSKRSYQGRIIAAKEKAVKQLNDNVTSVNSLVESYQQFTGETTNILGGSLTGQGDRDGDNARIVLDALPSKYDFPALATSLEKILTDKGIKIDNITGTDDEIAQAKASSSSATAKPTTVEIPFQVTVSGSYTQMQDTIKLFGASIRPFNIQSMNLGGDDTKMTLTISAKTYYLPEKTLTIDKRVIK